jgi:hypothetical protein
VIPCIQNVAPGAVEEIVDVALYGIDVVGVDAVGQTENAVEGEELEEGEEEEDFIKPVDTTVEYCNNYFQLLMRSEKAVLIQSGYGQPFCPFNYLIFYKGESIWL